MSSPRLVLTKVGQIKIADAMTATLDDPENPVTVHLTEIAVGDGSGLPVEVLRTRVALVNEVYRTDISAVIDKPEDETVRGLVYEIPASSGGYVIREMAVFDDDGDMIAHGPAPIFEKPSPGSDFALAVAGTVWLQVTDSDALSVAISLSDAVPQARVLTARRGVGGLGDLSADRDAYLDLGSLEMVDGFTGSMSFPVYDEDAEDEDAAHQRVSLSMADRRWRQSRRILLLHGHI